MNLNNFVLVGTVTYVRSTSNFVKVGIEYQTFEGQQKQTFNLIAYDEICQRMKYRIKPGQIISIIGTMSQSSEYNSKPDHNLINLKIKDFQIIDYNCTKTDYPMSFDEYSKHNYPKQTYNAPPDASNLPNYKYGKSIPEQEMSDYKMSNF